ncbi:MAG: tetratricopeptide repeat protein [Flavobacterium sp. JAD_PAG50586_2]|nr:MAG: tetratricopeptide repeat protein [Flavobacterium sp. JAD_PAG50586_2]
MQKLIISFLLSAVCFQFGFSQDIDKLLGKAFTSKDSSGYYFKLAKKAIKNERDQAQFYFCKGARHGDYNTIDSAVYYTQKSISVFEKLKDAKTLNTLYYNLSQDYRKMGQYDKSITASLKGLDNAEKIIMKLDVLILPITYLSFTMILKTSRKGFIMVRKR